MAHVRVMFVGHGPSNLPEDRVVNTFHFAPGGVYADAVDPLLASVAAFYTDAVAGFTVGEFLSPWVQRPCEVRAYDLDIAEGTRAPTILEFNLPAYNVNAGLPEEVACCLSYHGEVPPALNPTRRGRIYIGPLTTLGATVAQNNGPTRPSTNLVNTLCLAAEGLKAAAPDWCVRSTAQPGAAIYWPIAGGYVDDALDTQRRRGPRTTARTLWIAP